MTAPNPQLRSVVLERDLNHPPARVWRALTEPALLAEWLMATDFAPSLGRKFAFTADWGEVACEVLEIEPGRTLSYSWGDGVLDTVVTWTLTPILGGVRLRMEQTGFRRDQPRYLMGATAGWPRFLDRLEQLLHEEPQA
ncbi:SRPBCC family protein [Phenylobacterium sp.]|uniref:SRPBCC family protein n=1 Tax=Phenylobacterium sp. TaxID=1871053 RepID=UPI002FDAB754